MKLLILLFITTSHAFGSELSAGIRESFISVKHHAYGGDSTARLRRLILDRGFDSLTLNTKFMVQDSHTSYVHRPPWSSNFKDLDTMISLARLGRSKVTIKPQLVKGPMDNIVPYELSMLGVDERILLYTYQRELNGFLKLSRETDYAKFIIGSGINRLYLKSEDSDLMALHQYIRKGLSPRTKLAFNLSDLSLLKHFSRSDDLVENMKSNFTEISYALNSLSLTKLNTPDLSELVLEIENLYKKHLEIFGELDFSISDLILPMCEQNNYSLLDMGCLKPLSDKAIKNQLVNLAKAVGELKQRGVRIKSIELMAASTDFEPDFPDPRMIYYKKFFKDINLKEIFNYGRDEARVDPPLPLIETGSKLACIYYDVEDTEAGKDNLGRIHSTMLESLLGGFPDYYIKRRMVKTYVRGELQQCEKAFYIASHFSSVIPKAFIKDVNEFLTEKDFMWFNYKFSDLQKENGKIAFEVPLVLMSDPTPTPENIDVGFFQFFEYKGEEFYKKIGWSPLSNNFISSTELNSVVIKNQLQVKVLSQARHNKNNQKTPYIVRQDIESGGIWYIADLPFSFIHYEDRYLILTDILWDFLGEVPKSDEFKALVRIEDINPSLDLEDFKWAMTYLASEKVPFSLALIPYYADMIGLSSVSDFRPTFKPITKFPEFLATLKYAKNLDADFVWHGVAHQVDDFVSGFNGVSGSDYEFWLYPENIPIPYDSVDWVMNRLEMGEQVLDELDIIPSAWEIPHYAASVLDYYIFAKVFEWTYHRPVIFSHEVKKNTALSEDHLMFTCKTTECREKRKALLRNLDISGDYSGFGASLYPYPIYKDAYGQKIIPETLGMIDFAFYSKNTWRAVSSPEDILRRAKKLKVIRGAYASFFWHSTLLNRNARYYFEEPGSFEKIGGKKTLINVIQGLKNLGYKFVSISDCDEFYQKGCQ